MLKLSTKCQYGVRAMYEIARCLPEHPISARAISEMQDVPMPFLDQILHKLRKAGLILSVKGPGGGYLLNGLPDEVSIGDIVRELEGPVAITSCLDPEEGCARVDGCVVHLLWKNLGRQIEDFLNTIKLDDLVKGRIFTEYTDAVNLKGLGPKSPGHNR